MAWVQVDFWGAWFAEQEIVYAYIQSMRAGTFGVDMQFHFVGRRRFGRDMKSESVVVAHFKVVNATGKRR